MIDGQTVYRNTTLVETTLVSGYQDGANTAINAIQFSMITGNIASGTIRIYGVK